MFKTQVQPSRSHPPKVTMVSRLGPQGYGGLAAYQRGLASALVECRPDFSTQFLQSDPLAERAPFPVDSTCARARVSGRMLARFWPNLASRPRFHLILERLLQSGWHTSRETWPQAGGAVHFVGTGWDFFGFYALAKARSLGAKFSVWPATHPGVWGDDQIDLRLYRQADTVFCQSPSEANHLVHLGLRTEQIVISGLPPMCRPDGDAMAFRQNHQLHNKRIVLYLGRLDEAKGCDALVSAWKRVVASRSDAVLVMAGSGVRPAALDGLSISEYVFLGEIDESIKADALAACDIFCLPSREESFGIVYIEAWSYSKPVICGPAPATREWVQHQVNGIHSSQQPDQLAADLLELLDHPEKGREMGEAGHHLQMQNLTWPRVAVTHLRAFLSDFDAVQEVHGG